MRKAWIILLGTAAAMTVSARGLPTGIVIRDFSITDSPCAYKHDSLVERVLQTVGIAIDTAKATRTKAVASFELRNNSAKTITAYVLNYTFTHGGKTDYYGSLGADLVYEMAMVKGDQEQALRDSTFSPGGEVRQEVVVGGRRGQFEVFPCMVAFEDRTFNGPPALWKQLTQMRADNAKAFGELIADLKSARDSVEPKTFLIDRAKQIKRIDEHSSDHEPYRYLETVASELSQSDRGLDRKIITDHVSALEMQREILVQQSTFGKTE